jgi:hypothetical protein
MDENTILKLEKEALENKIKEIDRQVEQNKYKTLLVNKKCYIFKDAENIIIYRIHVNNNELISYDYIQFFCYLTKLKFDEYITCRKNVSQLSLLKDYGLEEYPDLIDHKWQLKICNKLEKCQILDNDFDFDSLFEKCNDICVKQDNIKKEIHDFKNILMEL